MAQLIRPDGKVETVKPKKGKHFTLKELQGLVGGYVELIRLPSGKQMLINEDGKLLNLKLNQKATFLLGSFVVGNAILVEPGEEL